MIKNEIANTGVFVSPIGLGTVKLGRDQGVKYPNAFKIPNDKEAAELISLAKSLGINLIDTAPAYGNSEERLGKLLKHQREDWVICTKVGEEFENGESFFNFSPEHTRFSIERSLKRLNTDWLDIVLIHSDGNDLDIINKHGTLEILAELKQHGLIRAFGMSTKTIEGGLLSLDKSDVAMITYNLEHKEEKPVIDYAIEKGKGIFIKKALASGHICDSHNEDPVKASFDFIFKDKGVTSAIVGTITPSHLKQNINTALSVLDNS